MNDKTPTNPTHPASLDYAADTAKEVLGVLEI
jgi:hypothetical protein